MSHCVDNKPDPLATLKGVRTVALAGNPNSGKTTIFNGLTGLRQKVANYPGVTVEKKTGRCKMPDGSWVDVVDLPGTYSLISRSPDEQIAMEVLRGLRADTPAPDVVIVVVDASNLQRNLYLVSQLIELGRPLVVALNMTDIAERRGLRISPERLSKQLGAPVVPLVGHKGRGIKQLKETIATATVAPLPEWRLPEAMHEELMLVGGGLAILGSKDDGQKAYDEPAGPAAGRSSSFTLHPSSLPMAIAERLLIGDRARDIGDIADAEPVRTLLRHATDRLARLGVDPVQADIEAHYHWIEDVAAASLEPACNVLLDPTASTRGTGFPPVSDAPLLDYHGRPQRTLTQKVDAILMHKVWGLLCFTAIMALLFVTIFYAADPIMGSFEDAVGWLGSQVTSRMPDGPLRDLVGDGIFAGVGGVVVFVPQIALLFLFLAIMEDSGYLARAAFLMDRLLAKVGLHGKSFIPMLSSFACAIPGIMATRTIENRKDRLATILVAPFMSCSARLPVYGLLIGAFFGTYSAWVRGGIMFALYALGVILAAGTAWVFKRSFLKGPSAAFILEMPTYKLPQASQVARQVWTNTSKFLTKAGTTIFALSVILWAMSYYPRLPEDQAKARVEKADREHLALVESTLTKPLDGPWGLTENQKQEIVAAAQSEYSISGRIGHAVEPVIRPLGYDWKMGVGLIGAFAAREVFVSTMGIVYSVGDQGDDTRSLEDAMTTDRYADGRPVWTPVVACSLLVFFVVAMQCISTLAIVRRETGGWRWPIFMLLYMNGLAYVLSLIVYQVGSRLFA